MAKRKLSRTIHAPGVVAIDERQVTVVAPRFDGFIDKVGPVTSGTHVKKGDPLMTVFGQELLNQAAGFSSSGTPDRAAMRELRPPD